MKESLLLHCCCAPCSPHVIRSLKERFELTVYFYNPNIHGTAEYTRRLQEMRRLCDSEDVKLIEGDYDPRVFFERIDPYSDTGERGRRCSECFRLRLETTAKAASEMAIAQITTTLTVSPHKRSAQVFAAAKEALKKIEGVEFLEEDFKKKDGFRKACLLSEAYGFYRQDYCGCTYSRMESEQRKSDSERSSER